MALAHPAVRWANARDIAVLVSSSEKAMRELGWNPRYTQLDDIIRAAWVWRQKRYKN